MINKFQQPTLLQEDEPMNFHSLTELFYAFFSKREED